MRIGILTFHFAYNYGAVLQSYALFKSIEKMEIRCEIIDYRPKFIDLLYRPTCLDFFHHFKLVFKNKIKKIISNTSFKEFEKFLLEEFVCSSRYNNINKLLDEESNYDLVIVGSDQVWNPSITNYDKAYLLDFVSSDVKKASFAASIGKDKLDKRWNENLCTYLSKFEHISVREESSKKMLENILSDKLIECIADPVFLLTEREWKNIAQPIKSQKKKYVLIYLLSKDKLLEKSIQYIAKKNNCEIIAIHPMFKLCSTYNSHFSNIGPRQFIWLILNAQYICTNSFHATAFSILFNKPMVIKSSYEKGGRVANLIEKVGLQQYQEVCGDMSIDCWKMGAESMDNVEFLRKNAWKYLSKITR